MLGTHGDLAIGYTVGRNLGIETDVKLGAETKGATKEYTLVTGNVDVTWSVSKLPSRSANFP